MLGGWPGRGWRLCFPPLMRAGGSGFGLCGGSGLGALRCRGHGALPVCWSSPGLPV